MPREKGLVSSHAVKIFWLDLAVDQSIQLVNGKTDSVELFFSEVQVRTDIFVQEDLTRFFVRINCADSKKQSEIFAQILKELSLIVQTKRSPGFK